MNTNLRRSTCLLGGLAVWTALVGSTARAQYFSDPGVVYGEAAPAQQSGFASAVPLHSFDGPIWIGYTPTSAGLGYRDGYTSLGGLMPFWGVSGDALWFVESQGHISDQGGLFSNLGFGRRIYEHSLRRSFGWSVWYDYDADEYDNFGHTFHQFGVNLESYGDHLDFHFNGYMPLHDAYTMGDGTPCFIGNNIILNQAIDAALRGMDFEVGARIPWLQALDLRGYVGGYSYTSHGVDPFLGLSTRLESHPAEYVSMQLRATNDERFGTNVMFGLEFHLGGRRHRSAYERMTEPVHRNDHIVRYHEDPQFAINPLTGQPYNVVHVDNSAALTGLGTTELPYSQLAFAQLNSAPNDVILVSGRTDASGNAVPYTGGIVLQDGQQLIGAGTTLVIRNGALVAINPLTTTLSPNILNDPAFINNQGLPIGNQSGTDFRLISAADTIQPGDIVVCDIPGDKPTITNPTGPAVTLANNNTVAGMQLTNSQVGILGNNITNFDLNNNMISNNVQGGIVVHSASGFGRIENNMITNNNRPNPPFAPNVPFANGIEVTVTGADSLAMRVAGNTITENDTGIRLESTTAGVVTVDAVDNLINSNVNDGINILQNGPGTLNFMVRGTGVLLEAGTGSPPIDPVTLTPILIPSAQISGNGAIDKVVDTNGNGRGIFVDALDGNVNMTVDNVSLVNNDSSFFPRYGALQFNLEPGVDSANVFINNNTIQGTGFHDLAGTIPDGFIDAGSAIRIVSNPGLGVTHRFDITANAITDNFGDGIKLLMLTEGIRTNAIPEGTLVANIVGNDISRNFGIIDDGGFPVGPNGADVHDDLDAPTLVPFPFPGGLASNPDPKNEFRDNINGSGLVVRATGTPNAFLSLNVLNNTFTNNVYDAINMAFAGHGYIGHQPTAAGTFTPVPFFTSPFGVNANVVIDNNSITQVFDDAMRFVLFDDARVALRISNNRMLAGDGTTLPTLPAGFDPFGGGMAIILPTHTFGTDSPDVEWDTAIEIDTWDTSKLLNVIDNNDILAQTGALWRDGGIDLRSHDNSVFVTRVTRNRINEVLDSNSAATVAVPAGTPSLANSGTAINLLAEGNSDMIAFVRDNDMENRTGALNAYFEATSADTARLCLQLLDNNAEAGVSPQLTNTLFLIGNSGPPNHAIGDGFFLIQLESSSFALEPTRGTNHESIQPENLSLTTFIDPVSFAPLPGAFVLPPSGDAIFGNVPAGTCEFQLTQFAAFGFPFSAAVPGFSTFDPPVVGTVPVLPGGNQ